MEENFEVSETVREYRLVMGLKENVGQDMETIKVQAFFTKDDGTDFAVSEIFTISSTGWFAVKIKTSPLKYNSSFSLLNKKFWVKAKRGENFYVVALTEEKQQWVMPVADDFTLNQGYIHREEEDLHLIDYIELKDQKEIEIDVAELNANLEDIELQNSDIHTIYIKSRYTLTLKEFKRMFYSAGTQLFKLGNCYENPDSFKSIEDSVWGITRKSKTINLNRLGGRGEFTKWFGWIWLCFFR